LLPLTVTGKLIGKGNIMRTNKFSTESLVQLFLKEKVITFDQIKNALGTTVKMTAIRKLKSLNYNTSYSHTGKYYTLHSIANYNKLGLWEFKNVYFSKFGSLKDTIENLVCLSQEGYSALELKQILKTEVQKPLFQLYSDGCLYREQIGDVYHYFSPHSYHLQKRIRSTQIDALLKDKIPEISVFDTPETKKCFDVLLVNLNEKQRRLYLGFESLKIGYGGDTLMSRITGVNIKTIARGRKELTNLDIITPDRIRKTGGGRHPIKKKRNHNLASKNNG